MPNRLRLLTVPFVVTLAVCVDPGELSGQAESTVARSARIDTVPLLTIGDEPDDPLFQVIGAVLAGDHLIVAEMSSQTIRFYDRSTGELLQTVGGSGEGPGEYRLLVSFKRAGDRLYAFDAGLFRATVLDLSGALERTVSITPWGAYQFPSLEGVFPDGSFLVSARVWDLANRPRPPMIHRDPMVLARYDANGVFQDSLNAYPGVEYYVGTFGNGGEAPRGLPFSSTTNVGVYGDGYFVSDNKDPMIAVFDAAGNRRRQVGPGDPPEPVRITPDDRDRFADFDGIDADEFPQFYPFYSGARVAGGDFWVLDYLDPEHDRQAEWNVYSLDGELLRRVTASERLSLLAVDGDVAVVLVLDDLNVETVELRRIVATPPPPGG